MVLFVLAAPESDSVVIRGCGGVLHPVAFETTNFLEYLHVLVAVCSEMRADVL